MLRALGLGDALTGIPALRGIRRAHPEARLVLACNEELGRWLVRARIVDAVAPTDGLTTISGVSHPDIAIDLHGRGPRSHLVLRATDPGELFGFACQAANFSNGPTWDDRAHEVDRWCALARWLGGPCGRSDLRLRAHRRPRGDRAPIVIHPGASSGARRWPVVRWRRLIDRLPSGRRVVVTGSAAETTLCAEVCDGLHAESRAGATNLAALGELVASSGLVISGDTGVAHLATAYAVPSVTLFGPVSPALWGPVIDPHLHRTIWHDDGATGAAHGDRIDPRLDAITVDEVSAAVSTLLCR